MKISVPLFPSRVATLAVVSVLSLLAACGGGGGADDTRQGTSNTMVPSPSGTAGSAAAVTGTPSAGALSVSGTVTGFGSVIIDGIRYDDTQAVVGIDNGEATAKAGALGDVKMGMSIDARVRDGKLEDVTVRAALAGPVAGVDPSAMTFTVYGQTVKVSTTGATPTVFEGVSGFDGLALSDRVEVHGTVAADRVLQATRVERKPREAGDPAVRLGGMVSRLDTVGKTFRLHDLTVYYSDAALSPAGATLADGQLVVLFGDTAPAASRFYAKSIRIKAAEDGATAAVGGRVTGYVSMADFRVAGVRVNAQGATLDGGTAADVVDGASVAVEGTVSAGVLTAAKLRVIKTPSDALSSLKGQISGFLSSASFKLRGMTVDASEAAFAGGVITDLGNGAGIIATGHADGNIFKAERVEFLSPAAQQTMEVSGEMRDWNAEARSFKLLNLAVRLADSVSVDGGTLSSLASGKRVAVKGTVDAAGVLAATRVLVLPDLASSSVVVVGGRAFDAVTYRFKLPNVGVNYTAETVIEGGTAADIANGVLVFAKGRFDPATRSVNATWIEVVKADQYVPRVAGSVSGYVSLADFRVGGQRVDASGATLVDGQASDLVNGVAVLATGQLVERDGARVLVATQLRFMQ